MGAHEVTQAQYQKIVGSNPSHFSATGAGRDAVGGLDTRDFPVEQVSWEAAVEFCKRLSALEAEQKAGRVYRLPSEAEWEYACRAGSRQTTPFSHGTWLAGNIANIDGRHPYGGGKKWKTPGRTCKVGSYRPNAWGLYDMHGNVWEWTADWYGNDYYRTGPAKDPRGPDLNGDMSRVRRGGSWQFGGGAARSAARSWGVYSFTFNDVGFRVVCELRPAPSAPTSARRGTK
jgi:formylglycine-generating enzyme required for sulfatase activity